METLEKDVQTSLIPSYSVLQSDRSSFCEDVVLGSFNISYREEDCIIDQKYEKQLSLVFKSD